MIGLYLSVGTFFLLTIIVITVDGALAKDNYWPTFIAILVYISFKLVIDFIKLMKKLTHH